MTKQKRAAAVLLGLVFAGGTIVTAGSASASVAAGRRLATASNGTTAVVAYVPQRPRCRWVRGHWRWDRRRGHRVWVHRHRVCRSR